MRTLVDVERRYGRMRSLLSVLMCIAVLLVISSCATTPLGEGELRLLRIQVPENGNLRVSSSYRFIINFESDGSAEIIRAVCICPGSSPRIYRPEDVRYGSKAGNFSLWLFACDYGTQRLECYVDYVSSGKRQRSNSVYGLTYGIN